MPNLLRRQTDTNLDAILQPQKVNEGIVNRLLSVPEGQPFSLRPGTDEIIFDEIKRTTWGEVIRELVRIGVLKPDDAGDRFLVTKEIKKFKALSGGTPHGVLHALTQWLNS